MTYLRQGFVLLLLLSFFHSSIAAGHFEFWKDGNQITSLQLQQGDSGSVSIVNSGDEAMTNLQITIPPLWSSYFSHSCPTNLNSGDSCTLNFTIPSVAPIRATRAFSIESDNADNSPCKFSVRIYVVGGIKCWGLNLYGQLGSEANFGSSEPNPTPTDVISLTSGVVTVTTGSAHSCALLQTGDVQCWGLNQYGQLGNSTNSGTMLENHTPLSVDALSGSVLSISNGTYHSCALLTNGMVYCWGLNQAGQIGRLFKSKILAENNVPEQLSDLGTNVSLITSGAFHSCALTTDGNVKCWGWNYYGQLGNPENSGEHDISNYVPVDVVGLSSKVVSLSGGAYHTCALLDTGSIECWGENLFGQLGNPLNSGEIIANPTPVAVQNLGGNAISIVSGAFHSCALLEDGNVRCWGSNYYGQLGNSTSSGDDSYPALDEPLTVTGLSGPVASIAAGVFHNCALLQSGSLECWGNNLYGQLGNTTNSGVATDNSTPLPVQGITNALGLANHNFGYTSCVLY